MSLVFFDADRNFYEVSGTPVAEHMLSGVLSAHGLAIGYLEKALYGKLTEEDMALAQHLIDVYRKRCTPKEEEK